MKLPKRVLACVVACSLFGTHLLAAEASNITSIQQQINQNQNALNQINNQLNQYESEREEYMCYLDDQKSEMMNLMKDIAYYEEAVAGKEDSIKQAAADLEEADRQREEQYQAMMVRIQYMYEQGGNDNYLLLLLTSQDFTDLLNRADYVDSLYAYDSNMLSNYEKLVSDISVMKETLENEKAALEEEQKLLDEHRVELERIMEELQDTISDYDKLVANAQAQAKAYKAEISRGQQQIADIKKKEEEARRREEEAKKKAEEAAKNNAVKEDASKNDTAKEDASKSDTSSDSGVQVSGSGTGSDIANFGLKYVGYPYVYGGNSLTNGVDCSGFVSQVYAQFGYDLGVRSSYAMRSIGTGVSLADAKAGDIICYSGHVALYIGNGNIVHAKNSQYGIVVDPVYYSGSGTGPTVLAVRRIIN